MNYPKPLIWAFWVATFCMPTLLSAQDGDLDEAVGLPDSTVTQTPEKTASATSERCSYLGYGRLVGRRVKEANSQQTNTSFPDGEARLAGQCELPGSLTVFGDGHGSVIDAPQSRSAFLDQSGIRWRPRDEWVMMVGKERNRRSPGLLVSPSDFLHTNQNLPGQSEERQGIWAARSSWQLPQQSFDLFLLPVRFSRANGLPENDRQAQGAAGRYYHQFENFDLDVSIGQLAGVTKAGVSSQGFISKSWKIYGEAGYHQNDVILIWERQDRVAALLGNSYDGDKFSLRLEMYHQEAGANDKEFDQIMILRRSGRLTLSSQKNSESLLFLRQNYLIANASLLEWFPDWNLQETLIYGIDDQAWMNFVRLEYLINHQWTTGISQRHVDRNPNHQFLLRSIDWETVADLKWSF